MILGCSSWHSGKSVLFLVHVLSVLACLYGLVDDYIRRMGLLRRVKVPTLFYICACLGKERHLDSVAFEYAFVRG